MTPQKNIYFLSDAHLGSLAIPNDRERELHLVHFLDSIKLQAQAVYLLGDVFDFWYEYRHVVPKGHTRLLGKLGELTDMGVEIHFFPGNHDLWCNDYLEKECGLVLHRDLLVAQLDGKVFCMGHGDGLDRNDTSYLLLRRIFHSHFCQRLFSAIHPRWGMAFGLTWAKHSRKKHEKAEGIFLGAEQDGLCNFAQKYLDTHPDINYFLFGHAHVEVDVPLTDTARLIILGDWISQYTYAVWDGQDVEIRHFTKEQTTL
ncbi:MAG: UDP-2,3-diacylglucosamine diphosphatase [Bacteroidaceae bacterium]|nr:UDP-2,3-diacylglucosamine diphosphatase [Bacteroidaceae bacterium]